MKKWLMLLLASLMFVLPANAESPFAQRAADLAAHMDTLASEEAYLYALIGSANGAVGQLAQTWAAGDHASPRLTVHADAENLLYSLDGLLEASGGTALSETAAAELNRRLPLSLPSLLIASEGTEALAAASACQTSTVFASDETGAGLYVLLYPEAVPVMVAWHAENGAVLMQAIFLPSETLAVCQSAEEIKAWMEARDIPLSWTSEPDR